MKRRDFLRATAAGGAVAAGAATLWPRRASATFGESPAKYADVMLPPSARATNILEVFMYGGVSPWETFYTSDSYGKNDGTFLYTFYDETLEALGSCGYPVDEANLLVPFAED